MTSIPADSRHALPSVGSGRGSSPGERLEGIDAIRGFALLGVFAANLLIFSGFTFLADGPRAALASGPIDKAVTTLELLLIENKFIGLFSFLFGVSFWLFLTRVRTRDGSGLARFYRRLAWLFVFGALHAWLLWCFDILRFYALWAVLLPLFITVPARRLLAVALFAAVIGPALISGARAMLAQPSVPGIEHDALALAAFSAGGYAQVLAANWKYDWYLTASIGQASYQLAVFGRLLLGLWAARVLHLDDLGRHRPALKRVLIVGGVLGLACNLEYVAHWLAGGEGFFLPFARRLVVETGFLSLTLAMAAGLALFHLSSRGRRPVSLLAPLGRMALTWYLAQTLLGIWLFYGFAPGPGLMGRVSPSSLALVWLAGSVIQVALAHAWMRRFRYGPAEWLWRSLTFGRMQPMRGAPAALAR